MKITEQILKQMISEAFEEYKPGPMMSYDDPHGIHSKIDKNEGNFQLMDDIVDRAFEMMGIADGDDNYIEIEAQLTPLSNEVVSGRLADIDGMARELIERYQAMVKKGQKHPAALEEQVV